MASTTWTPNARTVDVRLRSGRHVQCLPVRKTAGWKATDIAGYRFRWWRTLLPAHWSLGGGLTLNHEKGRGGTDAPVGGLTDL